MSFSKVVLGACCLRAALMSSSSLVFRCCCAIEEAADREASLRVLLPLCLGVFG